MIITYKSVITAKALIAFTTIQVVPSAGDMATTRPQAPTFNITESELAERAETALRRLDASILSLESVSVADATFENVIQPLAQADNELNVDSQFISLLQSTATSAAIRKASSEAVQKIETAFLAFTQNKKLFSLVDKVYNCCDGLDFESKRILDKLHSMFLDMGMNLEGDGLNQFTELSKRLIKLRNEFVNNVATDPGSVWKSEEELDGLSLGKLESLELHDGKRRVALKRPDIFAVLRQCNVTETRKEVFSRSQTIYPGNVEIFREIVVLRDEVARLLGHTSFAAQRLRNCMAKTPESVETLLSDLRSKLQPLVDREIKALEMLTSACPLHLWDFEYYHQKMLKEKSVDHETVSEYFPADYTLHQMMMVFQQIFALKIEEITDRASDEVWDPDVKMFAVWEAKDSSFLGYLYTDIYPRAGKYNHAANFNIRPVSFAML